MNWRQCVVTVLTVLVGVVLSGPLLAGGYHRFAGVDINVVSDQRGMLRKINAGSGGEHTRRFYVAARDAERYRLRVTNNSNERIGVVLAVDGRNIISGEKSYLRPSERMYILGPYQSREYEGWRTGRNRTNRFFFTGMNDSYAANWGDYSAMGVIAAAVFREHNQARYESHPGRVRKQVTPSAKSGMHKQQPGTGFGESTWSPSRQVRFVARQKPQQKIFIKYEWRSTLCRQGIISCRPNRSRNRFWPEQNGNDDFAPFPFNYFEWNIE